MVFSACSILTKMNKITHRKSFQHLKLFFMSTWWWDCKDIYKKFDADELDWLFYLAESSKSYCTMLVLRIFIHFTQSWTLLWVKWTKILKTDSVYCDISISCIFLQFPHQIRIKKVVKCWKNFSWYSATLGKHLVL